MTYTEKVHVTFGVLASLAGALALFHTLRPQSRAALVWPVVMFICGFILFVPVETQSRTYLQVGWWKTLLSLAPERPSHWLGNWMTTLSTWHVLQHKSGSLMTMVIGIVEWQRARSRLTARAWEFALPALLIAIGLAFGIHGGSTAHLPFRVEQLHHQILGVTFVAAGLTQMLVVAGRLGPPWRSAWAALVLFAGLDLALFYRLDPRDLDAARHHQGTSQQR